MSNKMYQSFLAEFLFNIDKDIENSKLAIFVGSGVSICSGFPSWNDVIKQFSEPLGLSKEILTNKELMEIPDKYHHKYKDYEFKKLLKDIFDISPTSITLQEKILQINPYHIITTNWDNLLEQAMINIPDRYYDIVHNDNDLSKVANDKLIINMNGSLSKLDDNNNAIVMKESEYLAYSDNFPLIENYVKSIFSTKRVLFIGYSLSDHTVQQIIHWVKNKTLNHIFPYLVVDGSYNETDFSFYKEKGIFLLYFDEILEFLGKETNVSYFEKYNSFLDLIIERKTYTNKSFSIIDRVYDVLKEQEEVSFLSPDILIDIGKETFDISLSYGVFGDRTLYIDRLSNELKDNLSSLFIRVNRLSNILKAKPKYKLKLDDKSIFILEVLSSSNINALSLGYDRKNQCILTLLYDVFLKNDNFDLFQKLLDYDFNELLQYSNKSLISDVKNADIHQLQLLKAFALYKLSKYEEAIIILQNTLKNSYLNKDFFIYFITKVNLKHLCQFKKFLLDDENSVKDFCENYKIDDRQIEQEIYNLPIKYKKNHILKIVNFDYFYKPFFDIQDLYDKNLETKDTFKNGGSSLNNAHNEIYNKVLNVFMTINFNFITIDKYGNIKKIYAKSFQALIYNYSIVDSNSKQERKNLVFPVSQNKELNQFIFYLGINGFAKFEKLSIFLKEELYDDKNKEYNHLKFMDIDNIVNVMLPNIQKLNQGNSKKSEIQLLNGLTILSWSELTNEHIETILNLFMKLIQSLTDWGEYDVIRLFLANKFNDIKSENLKILENILENFIIKFITGYSFVDGEILKRGNFLNMLIRILKKNQYQLTISQDMIFTLSSKLPIATEPEYSLFFLSTIYSMNKNLYLELRERHISVLLRDFEKKEFDGKDKFLKEINELLGIK